MRNFGLLLALVAGVAIAAAPITLDTSVRKEFTDCSSGGSSAQTLTANVQYLVRVVGEDTFVCFGSSGTTCASGGEKFGAPFAALMFITGDMKSVACRSANSTGDVIFTKAD
jgi:Flp pilus assembly pilin Flp